MHPIDRIVVRQTVRMLQERISAQLKESLTESLFKVSPQQMVAECQAFVANMQHQGLVEELKNVNVQACTKYEIHDDKNRCLVRLMDKDDGDIKFIWLRGRRKAHKVGRAHLGNVFLAFSMLPARAERSITFQVKVERKLEKGLCRA